MRSNKPFYETSHTGVKVRPVDAETQLKRAVMTCMLWEDYYYETGESVADRITSCIKQLPLSKVAEIARAAKHDMHLRHVPLFMLVQLYKIAGKNQGKELGKLTTDLIVRPDDMGELLSMYRKDQSKAPIPKQMKLGISNAFGKFSEYSLAKFDFNKSAYKLRDVMFLCHPKPTEDRVELYKRIANKQLATPDTWETELSAGKDKKETFERLIKENKLGGMAFLRNLRNMTQVGCDRELVRSYFGKANFDKVLPFRFIAAAKHAPNYEREIESAMLSCLKERKKLWGKTILVVDNSGSMYGTPISSKSEIDRSEAAKAVAILLSETCDDLQVIVYSEQAVLVPARRGFALGDAITQATRHGGTNTGTAVGKANAEGYDRIIVLTDGQSHERIPSPKGRKAYMVNIAAYKNGVGTADWHTINGWSEAIIDYIAAYEDGLE